MVPLPTVSNPPPTQQFLSSVLSQRGPSALPYPEYTKWLIRQHLVSLTITYPSLEPKMAIFTHNNGRSVNLLQADGTIRMAFQGVTYNIPVVIWLMESYPMHPPCVYVNPTRDMVIKRPHPHVNPSGLVSVPYSRNWVYPSSNLVDLVRDLSALFGRDPPLYSQGRPSVNPTPNPNPNFGVNPLGSPTPNHPADSSTDASVAGYAHPSIPSRNFPPSPYGGVGAAAAESGRAQPPIIEDPTVVFKRNAINKLVETVHGDVVGLWKTREAEMEGMLSAQAVLRQREEQLDKGLKEMNDEKESLEHQLQMVLMNSNVLDVWLRVNNGKKAGNLEDVDDAFECADVLSKQMLEWAASDLAIEDVVYSLDKAVQTGAVPFDQYLRSVRSLSREQFFHRAMAAKVRAAQLQAQVANLAARTQYVT